MPTVSPNMGLTVPIAATAGVSGSGDTGPGYAQNISSDLNTIDAHDHSAGKGVQVTPAGMNINADLNINQNNLTQIRAVRLQSQSSTPNGTGDINELYANATGLAYINAAGVSVQLTTGGNAIQGPTGPAGSPSVADYFQAGVTGSVSLYPIATGSPAGNAYVQWNSSQLVSGNITQATALGTGAGSISCNFGGLYEIFLSLTPTGIGVGPIHAHHRINATGAISGGSAIAASYTRVTNPSGAATSECMVLLPSGCNIETWIDGSSSANEYVVLSATGTSISIKRIG